MVFKVQHAGSVQSIELTESGLAGSPKVSITHETGYRKLNDSFFNIWSADVNLVAFDTKVLDLIALTFTRLPETRDLYTDQTLNLVALKTHADPGVVVTVVFYNGQDAVATIPMAHDAYFQLYEASLRLFGDHVDRLELLAINGPCRVSIVMGTKEST